ncbi:MAG: FAD-dependent oxidoreductase, partial [Solirubrobacterales bacterium]|nr:FAD-dependent oxidoreductase [Solirubrobacterales bacterium]
MLHTPHGYWLQEAGAVAPAPPLASDREVDVVVVGGGFTGLWTAWHVNRLRPDARVVVLEADACGRGPSGRNGGFCNAMWFQLESMRRRWGDERALAVGRAAQEAVEAIGTFCEQEGVDAWFRQAGYMQVSTAAAHDGVVERALDACRELGAGDRLTALSRDEVTARCAAPVFRAGAISPSGATVQPARLALGLRERLRARGVELHESSPVLSVRDVAGGVEARTATGTVRAGTAVLAIGAAA